MYGGYSFVRMAIRMRCALSRDGWRARFAVRPELALGPTLLTDQLDEPARHDPVPDRLAVLLAVLDELLVGGQAQGGDQDAPLTQLGKQGGRERRGTGGDQHAVERGRFGPAERS